MDDPEVRLVKKGKKRSAPLEVGRGSRVRDKFHALSQDYCDLLKETEAKKKRLESINRHKLRLLAEIKFLRRKYDSFKKSGPWQANYRLKKQVGSNEASEFDNQGAKVEAVSTSRNTILDLNQESIMNDEGTDLQMHQDHQEIEKFDQLRSDEDSMNSNANLSVCRDVGGTSASDDKRTHTWQDQVALKV